MSDNFSGCQSSRLSQATVFHLSSFYFYYFAFLGCLLPFWPLYLKSLGFSGYQVGVAHAVFLGTKIFAPSLAGVISDLTGFRIRLIRCSLMMTGVSFALFLLGFDYAELLIISALYSFFWNAILSQFEAYTLDSLAENSSVYSKIRMWGSIGFITLALILGRVFEWYGLSLLPLIMLSLIGLAFITSVNLSETPGAVLVNQDERESIIPLLKNKGVVSFLLVCLFMQISHGPYYSFYSLYMKGFGYSSGYIGFLWAFGVISEVILFWFFPKLLKRFAVYFLLQASILLSVIRWLLISMFPEQPGLILLAQALHAFSFGCLHVVSMVYVQRFFSKGFSGRGQALYSGVSYGLGGAIGAYLSGFLWEEVDHAQLFQVAALFSVLAAAFAVGLRGVGKN